MIMEVFDPAKEPERVLLLALKGRVVAMSSESANAKLDPIIVRLGPTFEHFLWGQGFRGRRSVCNRCGWSVRDGGRRGVG